MINEDFYVSLPSNVSLQEFPNNKQSNYTTLLAEPLEIPLNFQVALVEISNFSNFKIQLGKISFKNSLFGALYELRTPNITFDLTIENGIGLNQFCTTLNYEIENNFLKEEFLFRQKIAYESDLEILKQTHILNNSKRIDYIVSNKRPTFNILKKEERYEIIDKIDCLFRRDFENSGGKYDEQLQRFYFEDIEELKQNFDLLVINIQKAFNENKTSYFIAKKYLIIDDLLIQNGIARKVSAIENPPRIEDFFREVSHETTIETTHFLYGLPLVKYLDSNKIAIEAHKEIIFEGLISKILNNADIDFTNLKTSEIFHLPQYLQLTKYILVYTDIIESQYYGNVRSSILRTVNIKTQNDENVTFFDNPHYLNVCKTRIETINIEICDINGNHIQFQDLFSNVHITLHFRPKKRF